MSSAQGDDDTEEDRTCGGHWFEEENASGECDDDPRAANVNLDPSALLMRQFNAPPSSISAQQVLYMIQSRRRANHAATSASSIMTLRIELRGVRPKIWRTVQVPALLGLHDFHSKVIVPAMGRAPERHGYVFMLKPLIEYGNDKQNVNWGVGLGPNDCMRYRDAMLPQKMFGLQLCDTLKEDLVVGDLFYADNPQDIRKDAVYIYDLGDCFVHTISLENVQAIDGGDAADGSHKKSVGKFVELVDGARAAPPEDCGGNWRYADKLNEGDLDNDPDLFDLGSAQERVRLGFLSVKKQREMASAEVKSNCQCQLCERRRREGSYQSSDQQEYEEGSAMGILRGMGLQTMGGGSSAEAEERQTRNMLVGNPEFQGKNTDGVRCCNFCLDRECPFSERFSNCEKCRQKFYCSKECQKQDWDFRHKGQCKPIDLQHVCGYCGKVNVFLRCGRCKATRYCTKDCQAADWKKGGHRKDCRPPISNST